MTEVYQFNDYQIMVFALIFLRMTAFVVSWPVFGTELVSAPVKILFAMALAIMMFSLVPHPPISAQALEQNLLWLVLKEVFIGLAMGYLARMFFFVFQVAGDLMSLSMGLSSAQLFHPASGGRSSVIEQFYVTTATLFYLGINGHHMLIAALNRSFDLVPIGMTGLSFQHLNSVSVLVQEIVRMGVQIAAPVMIAILIMNLVLGVIGKTVPQINVLITSLPLNICLGLIIMLVSIPILVWQMHGFLDLTTERLFHVMRSF